MILDSTADIDNGATSWNQKVDRNHNRIDDSTQLKVVTRPDVTGFNYRQKYPW